MQREEKLLWGLVFSILLHIILVALSVTLLPTLAARWASRSPAAKPEVLTFRFRERTADVNESSRTTTPKPTPLLGRFDSVARDRERTGRDTPIPAGGTRAEENSLPGGEPAPPSAAGSPEAAREASNTPPEASGAGIADAVGSEISMLTGKHVPSRRSGPGGHGARTDAASGEDGALEFGDYSFSTKAWDYEPYWIYMRERLYANWHPPAAYKDYGIIQGGWTQVRAVLDRRGRLRSARIVGEEGHASLHPASFAAMTGAAPFRPLPPDFPEDSLVVTVRFIYMKPGQLPPPGEGR
jgi:hypothetical protein